MYRTIINSLDEVSEETPPSCTGATKGSEGEGDPLADATVTPAVAKKLHVASGPNAPNLISLGKYLLLVS